MLETGIQWNQLGHGVVHLDRVDAGWDFLEKGHFNPFFAKNGISEIWEIEHVFFTKSFFIHLGIYFT